MYLAHIAEDGRKQTIIEHLEGTAKIAGKFASIFNMKDEAEYIGMLHDIGKYSDGFQKRLYGGPKVDHSTAGALEAFKNRELSAAFCIAGHHSGLPDCGTRMDLEGSTLFARLNRAMKGEIKDYDEWENEMCINNNFVSNMSQDLVKQSFIIRMLYSCLVDADYLDTEKFMSGSIERGRRLDINHMERALESYISPWYPPKTELNKLRCNILSNVMEMGESVNQGLFTLTVPTGGGKTVASLAFAIKHAKENNLSRIIYVIPYTSIIEQTADIFREIVGKENVLEHHSGIELSEDEDSLFFMRATENWDMPVIVTTAVQFFESFYKNKSSSNRKLHNIANSVVIFDEAQMIPVPYLKPCVRVITELVQEYKASAVLCTATQPALNEIIEEFLPGYEIKELCPNELFDNKMFERVSYNVVGIISEERLASELNQLNQVLCIVNSRKASQEIYELLDSEGSYHLSTFMYPKHRKKVLEEIRNRLKNKLPCRVVSTSLIEAGVDVDFPCVYRQKAGLDSILQAGGRCNREGKREAKSSIVNIFDLECGSPEIFSMQIAACDYVLNNFDNITGKEAVKAYFEKLLYLKSNSEFEATDQKGILEQLEKNNFPFATVARQFNLIGNETKVLYIQTSDNEKEIYAVKKGFASKKDYRKLAMYGINIYEYQYNELLKNHAIEVFDNGCCLLIDTSLYSEDTGLKLSFDYGQALFI